MSSPVPSLADLLDSLPAGLAVPVWSADSEGNRFAEGGESPPNAGVSGASPSGVPNQGFFVPPDWAGLDGGVAGASPRSKSPRQKVATVLFFQSQISAASDRFLAWCAEKSGVGAWAKHPPEPPKGEHIHAVCRFHDLVRYDSIFKELSELDPHFYLDKGGNFRKCLRYCLHMDNPEKPPIPKSELHTFGQWGECELENLLSENTDFSLLFRRLAQCQEQGQSPEETCCFIVRMGYTMSQISQCVRAAKDVREYWNSPLLRHGERDTRNGDVPF